MLWSAAWTATKGRTYSRNQLAGTKRPPVKWAADVYAAVTRTERRTLKEGCQRAPGCGDRPKRNLRSASRLPPVPDASEPRSSGAAQTPGKRRAAWSATLRHCRTLTRWYTPKATALAAGVARSHAPTGVYPPRNQEARK